MDLPGNRVSIYGPNVVNNCGVWWGSDVRQTLSLFLESEANMRVMDGVAPHNVCYPVVFFSNTLQSFPSCGNIIKQIFYCYLCTLIASARLWRCLQLAVFIWCSIIHRTCEGSKLHKAIKKNTRFKKIWTFVIVLHTLGTCIFMRQACRISFIKLWMQRFLVSFALSSAAEMHHLL